MNAGGLGTAQRRPPDILGGKAHHHAAQARVAEETIEGVFKQAFAVKRQVLLGPVGAHARTYARCGNNDPERYGQRGHWVIW